LHLLQFRVDTGLLAKSTPSAILARVRVSVGDVRLFFDVQGLKLIPEGPWLRERPTVVLLHPGPGFDHGLFKVYLGPALAVDAQVLYVDLRGHGRSDRGPAGDLRLQVWADDVVRLCDRLGIERPVVIGHGFGATVAALYAARHAEHPAGLVLAAPTARVVPARIVDSFDRLGEPEAGEIARRFYEQPDHGTLVEYLRHCYPLVFSGGTEELSRTAWSPDTFIEWIAHEGTTFDLREQLGRIRVPTLVLAGEDDPYAPLASAREVADSLSDGVGEFVSYPGVRHPVFRETDPHALNEVRALLRRLEPEGETG
jgi:proline iminopeptidase